MPRRPEPSSSRRAMAEQPDDTLSYEAAREELVETVRRLEAGGTTLEESLALWERGEQLATICQQWLDGVRKRLDETLEEDGQHRVPREGRRSAAGCVTRRCVGGPVRHRLDRQQVDERGLLLDRGGAVDEQR